MHKSDSYVAINKILKVRESGTGLCLSVFDYLSFQILGKIKTTQFFHPEEAYN